MKSWYLKKTEFLLVFKENLGIPYLHWVKISHFSNLYYRVIKTGFFNAKYRLVPWYYVYVFIYVIWSVSSAVSI